ncbi:TPA: hypothetical protein JTK43_002032 [Escherichia coli]|nr:hypothetical protein [Escherichia coli]
MSIRLQQVKALLQGIRDDDALYDSLRERLQRQRICMIRRASVLIHLKYEKNREDIGLFGI